MNRKEEQKIINAIKQKMAYVVRDTDGTTLANKKPKLYVDKDAGCIFYEGHENGIRWIDLDTEPVTCPHLYRVEASIKLVLIEENGKPVTNTTKNRTSKILPTKKQQKAKK